MAHTAFQTSASTPAVADRCQPPPPAGGLRASDDPFDDFDDDDFDDEFDDDFEEEWDDDLEDDGFGPEYQDDEEDGDGDTFHDDPDFDE